MDAKKPPPPKSAKARALPAKKSAKPAGRLDKSSKANPRDGFHGRSGRAPNSSENASNNLEKALIQKYFKGITSHMHNADEVHVTGTGTIQEQFIHYLGEPPQFKNTVTRESTSNKMSDEKLIKYVGARFN